MHTALALQTSWTIRVETKKSHKNILEFNLFTQRLYDCCSSKRMAHHCYPAQVHGVLLPRT